MKKIVFAISTSVLLFSCNEENKTEEKSEINITESYDVFGDTISPEGAIDISQLVEKMQGNDSLLLKVEGVIYDVCQKKGCWMNIEIDEENDLFVKFRDYEFFVPKDAAGRKAIVEGYAYRETKSVDELRHYAEDAGEPDSVIMAITEPEVGYTFMANGVLIKK